MTEDRISMNSLGNLHGRVDFFGIETQKANKPIYEKLKVARRWSILQGVVITMVLAYLVLLTVWLAPFTHSVGFDAGHVAKGNAAKISQMKGDNTNAEDRIKRNEESIQILKEWRENQTEYSNKMHDAFQELRKIVRSLQNETSFQKTRARKLQEDVDRLKREKTSQATEIAELKNGELKAHNSSITELRSQRIMAAETISKLQQELEHLNDTIRDKFLRHADELNKTASTVASEARNHVQRTKEHLTGEFTRKQVEASSLVEQIRIDFNESLSDVKGSVAREKKVRQKEYRSLRESIDGVAKNAEKRLNKTEDVIDDAKSDLAGLQQTVELIIRENRKQDAEIANVTEDFSAHGKNYNEFYGESIANDREHQIKLEALENKVGDHQERLVRLGDRVNDTKHSLGNVSRQLDKDIHNVETSLVSLRERIDGVIANNGKKFDEARKDIDNTISDLVRLNRTVERMDRNMSENVVFRGDRVERMQNQLDGMMFTLNDQNLNNTRNHKRFIDDIALLKKRDDELEDFKYRMSATEENVNKTAEEMVDHARQTSDRIEEQNNLLAKQRISIETKIRQLQSDVEPFVRNNILMHVMELNKTLSNVTNEAKNHAEEAKVDILSELARAQEQAQALINQTGQDMQQIMTIVSEERELRQNGDDDLRETLSRVEEDSKKKFNEAKSQIDDANSKLNSFVELLKTENRNQDADIADTKVELRAHKESFDRLRNETNSLDEKIGVYGERLVRLDVRANDNNDSVNIVSRKVEEDILSLNESLSSNIAELSRGQKNVSDAISELQRQQEKLQSDFDSDNNSEPLNEDDYDRESESAPARDGERNSSSYESYPEVYNNDYGDFSDEEERR